MQAPATTENENGRLATLLATTLLDTASEARFDRLTQLVQQCLGSEIVLVSLVDGDRQWFKSRQGLAACETGRDISFCGHAILGDDIFEVTDATADTRFADNPLVTHAPFIRFYAGAVLTIEQQRIGTLCIIDAKPRQLNEQERHMLRLFADAVEQEIIDRLQQQAHQQIAQQLKTSRDQFQTLVANIPGITYRCLADEYWTMLYMSRSIDPLSGYPATDFINNAVRTYASVIHHEDRERLEKAVADAVAAKSSWTLQYRVLHKDGSVHWVEERGKAEFNSQGQLQFLDGFIQDITEQLQLQQMKDQFVSTVSHELRTPLTAINGALGLLQSGKLAEFDPRVSKLLNIAHSNSKRLQYLINDLLDIEKLTAGKMILHTEPLLLLPQLELALSSLQPYAMQFQVSLLLKPVTATLLVLADSQRLQQILANLLSNAIKFSGKQKTVTISVVESANKVRVAVQDQGPGIPQDFQPRLFERFAQAEGSNWHHKGGTGLGLAISKGLLAQMNGQIGFSTKEGVGSTFYFELPLVSANISNN